MKAYDLGKAPDIITALKGKRIYCNDSKGGTIIISLIDIVGKKRIDDLEKKLKAFEIIKEKLYSWSKQYINTDEQRVSNVLIIYDIDNKEKKLLKEVLL